MTILLLFLIRLTYDMRREVLVPTSGGHRGISLRFIGIPAPQRYPIKYTMYIYCNVTWKTKKT